MAKQKTAQDIAPCSIHPVFRDHFCYSLTKSGVIYRALLEESMKPLKIVLPQAGILHILAGLNDYNQNILGQEMNIDKASMVKFIDGLEKQGLVARRVDPSDRRAKLLSLTAKGAKLQKKISAMHDDFENKVLNGFSKSEISTLKKLMPRVLESVINYVNDHR